MKILKVIVDEIPESCGVCMLTIDVDGYSPICAAIEEDISAFEGNPYAMQYRRSDCPLEAVGAKSKKYEEEFEKALDRSNEEMIAKAMDICRKAKNDGN